MTYGRGESFVERIERLAQRSLNDGAAAEQRHADRSARAVEALEAIDAKFATVMTAAPQCFATGQPQTEQPEQSSRLLSWRATKPPRTLTITADRGQVNDRVEGRWLLHREISGFGAVQNLRHRDRGPPELLRQVWSVG
jgi:hypothetical protein